MPDDVGELLKQKLALLEDEHRLMEELQDTGLGASEKLSLEAEKAGITVKIDEIALQLKHAEIIGAEGDIRKQEEEEEAIIGTKICLIKEAAQVLRKRASDPDDAALQLLSVDLSLNASREEVKLKKTQINTLKLRLAKASGGEVERLTTLLHGEQTELGMLEKIAGLITEVRAATILINDPSTPRERVEVLTGEREAENQEAAALQIAINEQNAKEIEARSRT